MRSFLKIRFTSFVGMLAGLMLAGSAHAGYQYDPNYPLDPQFDPANYASELISSTGSIGQTSSDQLYRRPGALLGAPNLWFANTWLGDTTNHRVKIVEPPYNRSPGGNTVITQLNYYNLRPGNPTVANPGTVVVKMGSPVYADPTHAYGIDFIVYGNSFFVSTGGSVDDDTNLNTYGIGGLYGHPTRISVSQDGVNWYTYGDVQSLLPYNAYKWDRQNAQWTDQAMDQLKPVNPGVYSMLPMTYASGPGGASMSTADALDLYYGASGGTGYSLQGTGLDWIQYVKVEPGFDEAAGKYNYTVINAFAKARSMVVGDGLSIAPDNITAGTSKLYFQDPNNTARSFITLDFTDVSDAGGVATGFLTDADQLSLITGTLLEGYSLDMAKLLGTGDVTFSADLEMFVGNGYLGDGSDLSVLRWNGTGWDSLAFTFDGTSDMVRLDGVTDLSSFAVTQVPEPATMILMVAGGAAALLRSKRRIGG